MLYTLNAACPVKWTAVQERGLSRDFPGPIHDVDDVGEGSSHGQQRVNGDGTFGARKMLWTYARWLWLPESAAPLHRLPQVLRGISQNAGADVALHTVLISLLHTPRSLSEKYRSRIPRALETAFSQNTPDQHSPTQSRTDGDIEEDTSVEDEVMSYALKYDIGYDWYRDTELEGDGEEEEESDEKWRENVLRKIERREVLIQIILHFVALSLPLPPSPPSPSSPRKRRIVDGSPVKLRAKDKRPLEPLTFDRDTIEQHLEIFMDKLAMWQLMRDIDIDHPEGNGKGKEKAKEDPRDWMQHFCEEIIEPSFKASLPEQCDMLRSKVFPASPFSASDLDLSDSDGGTSAKPKAFEKSKARTKEGKSKASQLERTRSLSVTLQEEMDQRRSRSLSIGPGGDGMKKRALAREVSMSVGFKGKATTSSQGRGGIGRSQSRLIPKAKAKEEEQGRGKKRQGTTLVAATPSKPRKYDKFASSQSSLSQSFSDSLAASSSQTQGPSQGWLARMGAQTRLFVDDVGGDTDVEDDDILAAPCTPTPKANGRALHRKKANILKAVEGDGDDDAWIVHSSPDVLLLGDDEVWEHTVTPKKRRRVS